MDTNRSKLGFILGAALGFLCSLPHVYAAYDRPVTWADMSTLDLSSVFKTTYASQANLYDPVIPDSAMDLVLQDADFRVSDEFEIPEHLRAPVAFWLRVYTEYTTQHVVVFDKRHPEIVYEVLDFRDLAKTSRNRVVYEILSRRKIDATYKAYRDVLLKLAKNPRPDRLTPLQKSVLASIRKTKHRHSFKEFAENVRTQTGQRDNIIKGLIAAETFFPKMEQIFVSAGVPPELTRLSLVESSFNLNAISKVGASGVWQFMRKSALEYMIVDEKRGIDERLSPLKATVGAARLLKRNRKILGNWTLAVTSYNHGFTALRGIRNISSSEAHTALMRDLFSPCSKKSKLGWASRNYYAEFLAVVYAEAYRHLFYGDTPIATQKHLNFVRVTKKQSALQFAMEKGIGLQEFRFYNPDVRNLHQPLPIGFTLALPGDQDDMAAILRDIGGIKRRPSS